MKKLLVKTILVLIGILTTIVAGKSQNIYSIVGYGVMAFGGDGGIATSANIAYPCGIAIDASGNLYIADSYNNRVRKVNTAGVISTFAGTGVSGFTGDGGVANLARLNDPVGVAVDGSGNVYIADYGNNRIRKINPAGVISTFAGSGGFGFSGDGGPAINAQIYLPAGVTVDATGNVYIAQDNNRRIRKVNTFGIISTFAGNGVLGFSGDGGAATGAEFDLPTGVAADASGNVFIADRGSNRIRKVNSAGIISTFAGTGVAGLSGDGGPATNAQLNGPAGVSVDAGGNVYIADMTNNVVRKINAAGVISTIAGTGVGGYNGDGNLAINAQLYSPSGVAIDTSGNVYISDQLNARIREIFVGPCIYFPAITVVSNSSVLCAGDWTTVYVNGASTYSWSNGGTGYVQIITPSVSTTYSIIGSSATGCTNTAVFSQSVMICTAIAKINSTELETVNVYPNPSTGILNVEIVAANEAVNIQMTNTLGQIVLDEKTKNNKSSYNISHLPNGIYFITLNQIKSTKNLKIIKE